MVFLFALDRNLICMYVIIAVVVVFAAVVLFLADRAFKAIQAGRRRRQAGMRLYAAAANAAARERARQEKESESAELTAVLPTILKTESGPRKVA
ncbi:MAG TPA: hypothetical protein VGG75_00995 [Trebonia sp.]